MPRYFFHVTEGDLIYPDREGTFFSTPAEATSYAHWIARDLADDPASIGFTVTIENVAGRKIAQVSFKVEDFQ